MVDPRTLVQGMTRFAFLVVVFALPAVVDAQQQGNPSSIGLPLPPIGLPLPIIGLPPIPEPVSPNTPPAREEGRRRRSPQPAIVIFGAPYAFGYETWQQSPTPGVIAQPPAADVPAAPPTPADTGGLALPQLRPPDAQLFVDGEYVGTWSDHEGVLELTAGTHRIEIRASGHEALSFDVRIVAGRTITYSGRLTRIEEPPRQPPSKPTVTPTPTAPDVKKPLAPPAGRTIYLIPGCYLGNVPPEEVKLPAGCDLTRVITNKPQ
jgi:hypothetical protein